MGEPAENVIRTVHWIMETLETVEGYKTPRQIAAMRRRQGWVPDGVLVDARAAFSARREQVRLQSGIGKAQGMLF